MISAQVDNAKPASTNRGTRPLCQSGLLFLKKEATEAIVADRKRLPLGSPLADCMPQCVDNHANGHVASKLPVQTTAEATAAFVCLILIP